MRALMDEARADATLGPQASARRAMILGLGNDIIDIRRIEKTIARYGDRFLERVFTDTERQKSDGRAARAASYAKRFAAKEACAKALGTGLRRGVFWRDMGVVNLPLRPAHDGADRGGGRAAAAHHPAGYAARVDLTLTDDFPQAQAIVVISALPEGLGPEQHTKPRHRLNCSAAP